MVEPAEQQLRVRFPKATGFAFAAFAQEAKGINEQSSESIVEQMAVRPTFEGVMQ
ncbi:MAG: hypothetical protein ACXV7J_01085 [Methylomonas sp.]